MGTKLLLLFAVGIFMVSASDYSDSTECYTLSNLLYRTYDGSCNNLFKSATGKSGGFYSRSRAGAEYSDGVSKAVTDRPNERHISNTIGRSDPSWSDPIPHSLLATQFGQFVNHDVNNNRVLDPNNGDLVNGFPEHITFDTSDDFCFLETVPFVNLTLFNACLPPTSQTGFISTKASDGSVENGMFYIYNDATAWLDLSQIYAPNTQWNSLIRTHQGGLLSTTDYIDFTQTNTFRFVGTFPPYNFTLRNGPPSLNSTGAPIDSLVFLNPFLFNSHTIFTSGDPRVGENAALSMFHTLFIREHNRIAVELCKLYPGWTDEQLFEEARRRNIAQYQNIVLYEYFPMEFGHYFFDKLVGHYRGYDVDEEVATPIEFASAAFRYGHSSFRNYVPLDSCGNPTLMGRSAQGNLLRFGGQSGGPNFALNVVAETGGFENLIRGLVSTHTQPNDPFFEDTVRNLPFRFPIPGGTDLLALDLRRGRLNGVPNYNALRKVFHPDYCNSNIYGMDGCPKELEYKPDQVDDIGCFMILAAGNASLAQGFQSLYGKVNKVDAIMGLLAEPHVPGTSFGPTLGAIIAKTYKRARDGDRFWFENRSQPHAFSRYEIEEIRKTTIADLLNRNFEFTSPVPQNPFYVQHFGC